MTKRSVQKRVRAKRDAERSARKRQERIRKIRIWVAAVIALALAGTLFMTLRGGETSPAAKPTPPPTTNPTSNPTANPGCSNTPPAAYRGKQYDKFPPFRVKPNRKYTATIETSCGQMIVELLPKSAPKTVSNFVYLARQAYFDGLLFHRVIDKFMIQGGDPKGDGSGGPGYQFEDEIDKNLTFDKPGLLAMANRGGGTSTNGSQFFITVGTPTHLNGNHTIFGRLISGQETANKISLVARGPDDKPKVPVYILKIQITES